MYKINHFMISVAAQTANLIELWHHVLNSSTGILPQLHMPRVLSTYTFFMVI